MPETNPLPEISSMSFEDALAELEQIVRRLEAGRSSSTKRSSPTSVGLC